MTPKKIASCAVIASFLITIQGPAFYSALGQVVNTQIGQSPGYALPLPVQFRGHVPISDSVSRYMSPELQSVKGTLPARKIAHPAARNTAKTLTKNSPARLGLSLNSEKNRVLRKANPEKSGKRSWKNIFKIFSRRKRSPQKTPDYAYEQTLIDRVLEISRTLEREEIEGASSDELIKQKSDDAWEKGGSRSPGTVIVDIQFPLPKPDGKKGSVSEPSKQATVKDEKGSVSERGPPLKTVRLEFPLSDRGPTKKFVLEVPTPRKTAKSSRRAVSANIDVGGPGKGQKKPSRLAGLVKGLPNPGAMAIAATLTVAADFAARTFLPGIFGFSPMASLWVVAGMGSIMVPALAVTRAKIAKFKQPSVTPLKRYADILLGIFAGAAIVTVQGLSGADLGTLLTGAFPKGPGLMSLAPFLGLVSLVTAMPVIYGSNHIAYGLTHKRITSPSLPLHFAFKLFLLSLILSPAQFFLVLTGPVLSAFAPAFFYLPIIAFFKSQKYLSRLTARNASKEEVNREIIYRLKPAMRGILDPAPVLGNEWKLDKTQGPRTNPSSELRSRKWRSAFWVAALVLGALTLVAIHNMSLLGALSYAAPRIFHSLKRFVPIFLVSGFIAVLYFKLKGAIKRVREGPIYDMVKDLARKAGLPMPKVYTGKEKGSPNAFATGPLHNLAVVAVTGSITRLLSPPELRGVLGHELSHVKYRHTLLFLIAVPFLQILSLGATNLFQLSISYWAPLAWVLLFLAISRANERMADSGSAVITEDPRAVATGLRKMAIYGMLKKKVPASEGTWLYKLFLSHPTIKERVKTLGRMKKAGRS